MRSAPAGGAPTEPRRYLRRGRCAEIIVLRQVAKKCRSLIKTLPEGGNERWPVLHRLQSAAREVLQFGEVHRAEVRHP